MTFRARWLWRPLRHLACLIGDHRWHEWRNFADGLDRSFGRRCTVCGVEQRQSGWRNWVEAGYAVSAVVWEVLK